MNTRPLQSSIFVAFALRAEGRRRRPRQEGGGGDGGDVDLQCCFRLLGELTQRALTQLTATNNSKTPNVITNLYERV